MLSFFCNGIYIVIFCSVYLNMAPIGLRSLETRMKVSSPNHYSFKKLSVLAQTITFLRHFLTNLTAVWNIKVFLIAWYTHPVFYLNIRKQSGYFCETSFLKAGLYCIIPRKNIVTG